MTPPPAARPATAPASTTGPLPEQQGLTDGEFAWVRDFLRQQTGIELKDGKQALVVGRLARRLRHHGMSTFAEYLAFLQRPGNDEVRIAVDLLTTNETYFFREDRHFALLADLAREARETPGRRPLRLWSAASSSGEEAFSAAMVLADQLGGGGGRATRLEWEILATDISTRVLDRARTGVYPLDAAQKIPAQLLKAYCLRGRGEYDGYLAVEPALASRIRFEQLNLIEPLPERIGTFDVVFLRNVMIYFGMQTKAQLVANVENVLRPGGYLLVSHSETLNGLGSSLQAVSPSVYRVAR